MLEQFTTQLERKLRVAAAQGLNDAAVTVTADIKESVQVRTGRLRDAYAIEQSASPDNLIVIIDAAAVDYDGNQYPHDPRTDLPPEINRATQSGGGLFVEPSGEDDAAAVVMLAIEKRINQALSQ